MSQEDEPLDSARDSVLYLIDGSASMAASGALALALQAASDAIRTTAKVGDSHYDAGVITYNVAGPASSVQVLLSLGEPSIDDLKQLIRLAADPARRNAAIMPAPLAPGAVPAALRVAKAEMNKLRVRSLRRLVLITDDDDPCRGHAREAEVAQTFSTDLTEMQVAIFPIFIQRAAAAPFDADRFWRRLSYVPPPLSTASARHEWSVSMRPVDLERLGSSFGSLVFSKSRRKTAVLRGRLRLEALHVGVRGYNVVQSRPRRPAGFNIVYVRGDDGRERCELVANTRKVADSWSGKEVGAGDVAPAFSLGSKKAPDIPVTPQQLDELRHFTDDTETMFDVQGFMSAESVHGLQYGFVGHSTLLVPSSDRLQNSTRAFGALHRSMRRLRQVALATMTPPKGRRSPPSIGFLYAFDPAPVVYEKQRVPLPDASVGLYFVPLPYADDVRHVPPHAAPAAAAVDYCGALKELVDKLVLKFRLEQGFDPARFHNPRAAQFSAVLESLALSLEMETKDEEGRVPVEQKDPTRPRYEKIIRNAGNVSAQIQETLDAIGPHANNVDGTDRLDFGDAAPPPKRPRESRGKDLNLNMFRDALRSGSLDRFVVADLKWALRELGGVAPNMKKADLVQALVERLSE